VQPDHIVIQPQADEKDSRSHVRDGATGYTGRVVPGPKGPGPLFSGSVAKATIEPPPLRPSPPDRDTMSPQGAGVWGQSPLSAHEVGSARSALGTTADFAAAPKIRCTREAEALEPRAVRERLQDAIGELMPRHRCRLCQRRAKFVKGDKSPPATVAISGKSGTAHLRDVFTCGNVWICPTCAVRVSEARREELHDVVLSWQEENTVAHTIFTFPHSKWDRLDRNLDKFNAAVRWLTGHRRYRKLRKQLGCVSTVRALEVTWGESNGWHPHSHMLMFIKGKDVDLAALEVELKALWREACLQNGLREPSDEYGLKVEDGNYAADYVSKWGCAEELTKAHVKRGKRGSLGPWGLLHEYAFNGDCDAGDCFVEYAKAFKGKHQLQWSRGGRAAVGLDVEMSDAELANHADDTVVAEAKISTWGGDRSDFALVIRYRAKLILFAAAETAYKAGLAIQPAVDTVIAALRAHEISKRKTDGQTDTFIKRIAC